MYFKFSFRENITFQTSFYFHIERSSIVWFSRYVDMSWCLPARRHFPSILIPEKLNFCFESSWQNFSYLYLLCLFWKWIKQVFWSFFAKRMNCSGRIQCKFSTLHDRWLSLVVLINSVIPKVVHMAKTWWWRRHTYLSLASQTSILQEII